MHACDKKLIFFLKFYFFPKIAKILIKRRIYVFFGNLGLPGVAKFCTRATKNEIFFEILFFSKNCQNSNKTQNLCIFGNLGLPGVGKFCTLRQKVYFFLYIFFYRDCGTFLKKVNLKKIFYFLTRTCKIHQHWIPIGSPIIYKFCVL